MKTQFAPTRMYFMYEDALTALYARRVPGKRDGTALDAKTGESPVYFWPNSSAAFYRASRDTKYLMYLWITRHASVAIIVRLQLLPGGVSVSDYKYDSRERKRPARSRGGAGDGGREIPFFPSPTSHTHFVRTRDARKISRPCLTNG